MQLTRNVPKNDEQHIQRVTPQRSTGKLYGRLCNTSQNNERIIRKDNPIFEDCGEI